MSEKHQYEVGNMRYKTKGTQRGSKEDGQHRGAHVQETILRTAVIEQSGRTSDLRGSLRARNGDEACRPHLV